MTGYDFPTSHITIRWDNGSMNIVLDEFFPAIVPKAKKVFALLVKDPEWTNVRKTDLLAYFGSKSAEHKNASDKLKKELKEVQDEADIARPRNTKRNTPEYIAWTVLRDKAKDLERRYKEAVRKSEGYIKTALLLMEADGRE